MLAFSRPLKLVMEGRAGDIVTEATGRLNQGQKPDTGLLMTFYGPMLAAIVLKKAISMVRKTARV